MGNISKQKNFKCICGAEYQDESTETSAFYLMCDECWETWIIKNGIAEKIDIQDFVKACNVFCDKELSELYDELIGVYRAK